MFRSCSIRLSGGLTSCQFLFLSIIIGFTACSIVYGQSPPASWTKPGTGNWFVSTNWSTGTVPTIGQNAFVDNGGTTQISGNNAELANLTIGDLARSSRVEIGAAHHLHVDQNLTIGPTGVLQLDLGGGLNILGTFTNNGTLILNVMGAQTPIRTVFGTGNIIVNGSSTITDEAILDLGAHVFVNGGTVVDMTNAPGTFVLNGPNTGLRTVLDFPLPTIVTVNNGATFDNFGQAAGGVISTSGSATIINETGGNQFLLHNWRRGRAAFCVEL